MKLTGDILKLTLLVMIGVLATIRYLDFRKDIKEFRARNPVVETNK